MSTRKVTSDVAAVRAAAKEQELTPHGDPLLAALASACVRRSQAEEETRLLLAYARRFVYPHPYTLGELAEAAGMSVSGVRTAFGPQDVQLVAEATGMEPVAVQGEES
jgi:AraC-like DNA-binding protein